MVVLFVGMGDVNQHARNVHLVLVWHGGSKSQCKEYNPGAYCGHGRIKSTCKKCTPSAYCEHGRI
jgi:hypothetical protein